MLSYKQMPARILALTLLLHISLAPIQHVDAVKRTMPMIGMDEDGEESEDTTPATTQPRNALRSMINSFLTPSTPSQFQAMSPVDREYARQAQYPAGDMSDLNGGDDEGSKGARTPNVLGSGGSTGVMSYHGGKIVSTPLQVYLIMCAAQSHHTLPNKITDDHANVLDLQTCTGHVCGLQVTRKPWAMPNQKSR